MLDFIQNIDNYLFHQVNVVFIHQYLDIFFVWITDLHKTIYFKIFIIPLVAFLFIKKFKCEGWALFFALLISLGVSDFVGGNIKHSFERKRPKENTALTIHRRTDAGGFSFYSNHASNMFTFASYTGHFIPQIKIPLYIVASLVGYSRVYNGVHYPSDVFAGSIVGYLWGRIASYLAQILVARFKKRKKQQ